RAVPARTDRDPLRAAVEVVVAKREGLDARVALGGVHRLADHGDVPLVQDLVALEIERPLVTTAVVRDHLLLPVDEAAVGHGLVPLRGHDPDAGIVDRLERLPGAVVAIAERDDVLVDQRQGGTDARHDGIAESDAVAEEGEGADAGTAARRFIHRPVRPRRHRAIPSARPSSYPAARP